MEKYSERDIHNKYQAKRHLKSGIMHNTQYTIHKNNFRHMIEYKKIWFKHPDILYIKKITQ